MLVLLNAHSAFLQKRLQNIYKKFSFLPCLQEHPQSSSNQKDEETDPVADKPEESHGRKPDFLSLSGPPVCSKGQIQATIPT